MTILSPILISSHRRQVLNGWLSSSSLKTTLESLVKAARDDQRPEVIFTVNHNLLWHLAHCPRIEDRQVALDIATGFEEVLEPLGPDFGTTLTEASFEALPYSIVGLQLGPSESVWAQRLFPDLTINWKESYGLMQKIEDQLPCALENLATIGLLSHGVTDYLDQEGFMRIEKDFAGFEARHQTKGPRLIFEQLIQRDISDESVVLLGESHVPPYRDLLAPEENLSLDQSRLALECRNLSISFTGDQYQMDLLSFPEAKEERVFKNKSYPEEIISSSLFSHEQNGSFKDYLFCLFIKNGMPIGYAISQPTHLVRNSRGVALHIFREFRGSPSSSRFFKGFLRITHGQFGCSYFATPRDLTGRSLAESNLGPEDQAAITRFYQQHGFEWWLGGREWMIRGLS